MTEQSSKQEIHDAIVAVTIAAEELIDFLNADCPEVRQRIHDFIEANEIVGDPITKLFKATEVATFIARKMERVT